jgi:hypothetical protein
MFVKMAALLHHKYVGLLCNVYVTHLPYEPDLQLQIRIYYVFWWPITVAASSETLTVFARSNTRNAGSNLTPDIDICVRLFCVCVVLCSGRGLATGWSPVRGVQLKNRPKSKGLLSHREVFWCLTIITLTHACYFWFVVISIATFKANHESSAV